MTFGDQLLFEVQQSRKLLSQGLILVVARARLTRKGANFNFPVRLVSDDPGNLHAAEALQEEIGGSVVVLLARAHYSDGGHPVRRLGRRIQSEFVQIQSCHGKQTIAREHVREHPPVARLKNV